MKKARQISVGLENKPGRLAHFCGCLAERNINIIAISVAETTEQGVVRMVVDKPASAVKMLKEYCPLTYSETDVLLIDLPNEVGALAQLANKLSARKVNVNFVYGSTGLGAKKSYIIVGAKNIDAAARALRSRK
jgi:hypothetical protein